MLRWGLCEEKSLRAWLRRSGDERKKERKFCGEGEVFSEKRGGEGKNAKKRRKNFKSRQNIIPFFLQKCYNDYEHIFLLICFITVLRRKKFLKGDGYGGSFERSDEFY